ncbi:phage tail tube protein [Duganella sp. BJB475]|uniref:phage tail tube protein n=1 Tax=Duganella sp. BJB475 TaxID=2233914 RepID=UPI000E34F72B|nr:phage tail tube protein [Duganella sp. BJB475]RFP19191.1 hypothetical protein D0T23_05280 [Duganella sp. BJB475]
MTVAQGINKKTVVKVQTGLGVPAAGTGGQELRRVTSVAKEARATYENNEIVGHQQSTGVNLGTASTDWQFDGLLSPGTYSSVLAALIRKAFTATAASTALSLTVAGAGPYTLTRATGSFLTDGVKIGDVVRITAGTYANPVNRDNNILLTGVTALVLTGVTLNGTTLIAEGPVAASTVTVIGKKAIAPLTGHTDVIFTVEEWYADIARSELFPDIRIGKADVGIPASGNCTLKLASMGLGVRTLGSAQVLTTPTAATTTPVLTGVRGVLVQGGVAIGNCTGVSFSIDGALTAEGPVVGSNFSPDMSRGRIKVTGQFTALFDSATLSTLYHGETLTSLIPVMTADTTNNSDFVAFNMSAIKLTGDAPDDGEKAVIRTYPFTAQLNAAGGAALANDQTIISIQDSLA